MADEEGWRAKQKKVMSPENFLDKIKSIRGLFEPRVMRDRALIVTMYLTAGRVGEIVRQGFLGTGKDGLCKEDITRTNRNSRVFRIFQIRNLKNKKRKFKQIPVAEDDLIDGELLKILDDYLENIMIGEPLFPLSIRRAQQICEKHIKTSPHYFRHMRLTHLARRRNFTLWEIMSVAGHSDTKSAMSYIHDDPLRLLDKL